MSAPRAWRGTKDPAEQRAWQALRAGEPDRAMAHYASRRALHLTDTHDQAAEAAVQAWAQLAREHHDIRDVASWPRSSRAMYRMRNSRRQTPSLTYQEPSDFGLEPFLDPPRLRHLAQPARWLGRPTRNLDRTPDDSLDRGR